MWDGSSTLEHYSLNGSIGNPAESSNSGMLAAGAASWNTQTQSNHSVAEVQHPTTEPSPTFVGADRTKTVSYATGEFYGTSASAPHVAGLAALVKQRFPGHIPRIRSPITSKTHAESRGAVPNTLGAMALPSWPPLTRQLRHPNQLSPLSRLRNPRQNRLLLPEPTATPEPHSHATRGQLR